MSSVVYFGDNELFGATLPLETETNMADYSLFSNITSDDSVSFKHLPLYI